MSSTYTQSDAFEKMATGDQPNNWGATLDQTFDLIDQALDGDAAISLTGLSTYTLVTTSGLSSNGRCRSLVFSGSPSGAVAITIPAVPKWYFVQNSTAQNLVFTCGAGTYTLPASAQTIILCDGTNVFAALNNAFLTTVITSLNLTGSLSVSGNVTAPGYFSSGAGAIFTFGAGAGSGASFVTDTGNSVTGGVIFLAGTAPSAGAIVVSVRFAAPATSAPNVFLSPGNFATSFFVQGNNTLGFDIYATSAVALVAGQSYGLKYFCIG